MKKIILLLFIASSLHVFAQSGEEKTDEKKGFKRKDYLQAEALMQDFELRNHIGNYATVWLQPNQFGRCRNYIQFKLYFTEELRGIW